MHLPPRLYSGVRVTNSPCYPNVRRLDGAIIPMVNRMMRNGIAVDIDQGKDGPCLKDLSLKLERLKAEEYSNIQYHIPAEVLYRFVAETTKDETSEAAEAELNNNLFAAAEAINLNSPDQLAKLLFDYMGLGEGVQLKKTKGGDRLSTGKKQLEAVRNQHPIIASILRYREYAKLKSTYADALPKLAQWDPLTKTRRIHTQFMTTRTETGRLASRRPNLQNIPARSDLGAELRACFTSSPGCVLLSRDYSQIELRILAHEANEPNMLRIFADDGDIHDASTRSLYNLTIEQWEAMSKSARKKMRAPVKATNFGIAYSLSALGLQQGLMINDPPIIWSVEECQDFIDQWFGLYPGVKDYMNQIFTNAIRYGMVWDLFGRTRLVPGVYSIHHWIKSAALREAGNMPIQSGAQGVLKLAMAQIEDETEIAFRSNNIRVEPLLQVHDELIWDIEEDKVDAVSGYFGEIMNQVVRLRAPLKSEASAGKRWEK